MLAAILIVPGIAFGLMNVALYELLDTVAPSSRATEAYTWMTTSSSVGSALGAAVAGRLTESGSSAPALFITALAIAAAVVALGFGGRLGVAR